MKKIKLQDLPDNMIKVIATAMIKQHGFYKCVLNGEKVKIIEK